MSNSYLQLFIKTLEGESDIVLVDMKTDTVLRLKKLITGLFEIPISEQRLIFCGKEMENEMKLNEFGLSNGTSIHLVRIKENEDEEEDEEEEDEEKKKDLIEKIDYLLDLVKDIECSFDEMKATNELLLDC
jgi:ubiquitin-large subunit ribosomal protein L40e